MLMSILQLDRYKDLHARGIIHNGIKPGNICLPVVREQSTLYIIDFGFSFAHDTSQDLPLPSARRADTVGNRSFLSIYGHHGICMFISFIIFSKCFPSLVPFLESVQPIHSAMT